MVVGGRRQDGCRGKQSNSPSASRTPCAATGLRYEEFQTVTRDTTLEHPTGDPQTICKAARVFLKRVALDRKLRLLGVRVDLRAPGQHGRDNRPDRPSVHDSEAGESLRLFD